MEKQLYIFNKQKGGRQEALEKIKQKKEEQAQLKKKSKQIMCMQRYMRRYLAEKELYQKLLESTQKKLSDLEKLKVVLKAKGKEFSLPLNGIYIYNIYIYSIYLFSLNGINTGFYYDL